MVSACLATQATKFSLFLRENLLVLFFNHISPVSQYLKALICFLLVIPLFSAVLSALEMNACLVLSHPHTHTHTHTSVFIFRLLSAGFSTTAGALFHFTLPLALISFILFSFLTNLGGFDCPLVLKNILNAHLLMFQEFWRGFKAPLNSGSLVSECHIKCLHL